MGDIREPLRELTECGLPQALEVMGERWSFMILRASFNGLHHFEEFLSELGIARNILSNRLAKLVEHGILKRDPCADDKRKIEYRLTDKGLDLLPAMVALRQWGQKYGAEVVETRCWSTNATACRSARPRFSAMTAAFSARPISIWWSAPISAFVPMAARPKPVPR